MNSERAIEYTSRILLIRKQVNQLKMELRREEGWTHLTRALSAADGHLRNVCIALSTDLDDDPTEVFGPDPESRR